METSYRAVLVDLVNTSAKYQTYLNSETQRNAARYAIETEDRELAGALLRHHDLLADLREEIGTAWGWSETVKYAAVPAASLAREAARRQLRAETYQAIGARRNPAADLELLLNPDAPLEVRETVARRVAGRRLSKRGRGAEEIVRDIRLLPGAEGAQLRRIIAEHTEQPELMLASITSGAAPVTRIVQWTQDLVRITERHKPGAEIAGELIMALAAGVPRHDHPTLVAAVEELGTLTSIPPNVRYAALNLIEEIRHHPADLEDRIEALYTDCGLSPAAVDTCVAAFTDLLESAPARRRREIITAVSMNHTIPLGRILLAIPMAHVPMIPELLITRIEHEDRYELLDMLLTEGTLPQQRAAAALVHLLRDEESYLIGLLTRLHAAGRHLPLWIWDLPLLERRLDLYVEHAPYSQLLGVAGNSPQVLTAIGERLLAVRGDVEAWQTLQSLESEFRGTLPELLETVAAL